jgi:hypothetical protein
LDCGEGDLDENVVKLNKFAEESGGKMEQCSFVDDGFSGEDFDVVDPRDCLCFRRCGK